MVGSFLFSECMPRWLQRFLRKPELGVVLYNWLGRQKDKKQLLDNWQFDCLVSLCHPLNVDDQWVHSSASSHFSYKSNIWTVSPKHTPPAETYTKIPIYCIGTHTHTHFKLLFTAINKPHTSHLPPPFLSTSCFSPSVSRDPNVTVINGNVSSGAATQSSARDNGWSAGDFPMGPRL